jgi:cytochrome c oxidase assembly protein subunit 15
MVNKRKLFEEVGPNSFNDGLSGKVVNQNVSPNDKWILTWLWSLLITLIALIVVGGLTRLTDSGLSIVEWKPVTGFMPPLSQSSWLIEFSKYKNIPEFKLINFDITLEEFKFIYWWEWGHRQLARFLGLVWFVGFVFFWISKRIPKNWGYYFLGIGFLGSLQGFLGWWMVSSGLTGRVVDVFSYRLAIHLSMAFIILFYIFWAILRNGKNDTDMYEARRYRNSRFLKLVIFVGLVSYLQLILGALVAGIDAGRGYNDWPLMNGSFIPDNIFGYQPFFSNFFENPGLVQFNHRMIGYLLFFAILAAWFFSRKLAHKKTVVASNLLFLILIFQIILGITTVLYRAPMLMASFHQFTAIIFILAYVNLFFNACFPIREKISA